MAYLLIIDYYYASDSKFSENLNLVVLEIMMQGDYEYHIPME